VNWNFGIQHSIGNNLSLEIGYVGNHGARLTGFTDINQTVPSLVTLINPKGHPFGAGTANPFPYLNFINQESNDAHSNYDSLQVTLTKRISHGLSFIAGYTYGHGLDNNSLNRSSYLPQDSTNPGAEYGSSDFDMRHRFTFTATYAIPGVKGFAQLLEGWKLNSIVNISSPQPWLVNDFSNDFRGGDSSDRWNINGNPANIRSGANSIPYCSGFGSGGAITSNTSCTQKSGVSGATYAVANAAAMEASCVSDAADTTSNNGPENSGTLGAFGCLVSPNGGTVLTPPAMGTFGNMGRNIFRDSGFKNVDFSVFKTFTLKERYSAQFRVEFFNLFNHPDVANPYGSSNGYGVGNDFSNGSQFGCGCATADVAAGSPQISSGAARSMQLGLKLTF
jgi:hypothetical protein